MIWNGFRTALLFGVLTGILLAVAYVLRINVIYALLLAGVMNFGVYWFSDRFVFAMTGAKEVSAASAPELHRIVERLASQAGIPKPRVAIVESQIPNAFATGRSPGHSALAVHTSLLNMLNEDELEGVLGHEMTHVKNYDTLTSVVAATVAGAISFIAQMGWFLGSASGYGGSRDRDQGGSAVGGLLLLVIAPLVATLIHLAISRSREYAADEGGAKVSGKPEALASALQKMESWSRTRRVDGNPALAHLYIVNPFRGSSMTGLFSTHPSTEKRIQRLQKLAASMGRWTGHTIPIN